VSFKVRYEKTKKGVTKLYQVDFQRVNEKEYISAMGKAGTPHILDLGLFMGLSDAKKIDELFRLFPPGGDIQTINSNLDAAKKERDRLRSSTSTAEGTLAQLTENRTQMELPAGTLAEVTHDIKTTNAELSLARKNLKDQEVKEAEVKAAAEAKAKAEKEAEEKAERDREEIKRKAEEEANAKAQEIIDERLAQEAADRESKELEEEKVIVHDPLAESDTEKAIEIVGGALNEMADAMKATIPIPIEVKQTEGPRTYATPIEALEDTARDAGCEDCALLIVAKKLINEISRGANGH